MKSEFNALTPNELLISSVKRFQYKNNRLPIREELEAEVINCACLFLLENHKANIKQVSNTNLINNVVPDNLLKFQEIAFKFTEAAKTLFPKLYNEDLGSYANLTIIQNISWAGMLDFLRVYYKDYHGINIDNQNINTEVFISIKHDRLENSMKVSDSFIRREIRMNFIESGRKMLIEISPTISPKNTYLMSENDTYRKYKGEDPDFEFTLYSNGGIVNKVIFDRLDMNTRWIYS